MENARFGRIRLRHLQAFLAVARLGALRRAAEALAITQPAVTKTINDLEEILEVRLFERGRRGAVLTAEAERFMRHASASVASLELAVGSVAPERGSVLLRIGVLPTATSSFVPRALLAFKALSPATRLRVVSGANAELLLQLQQRELDLVVGRLAEPAPMSGLTFEHLYSDALVIAVRPAHPRLAAPPTRPPRASRSTPANVAKADAVLAAGPGLGWQGFDAVLPMSGTIIRHAADSLMTKLGMQPGAGTIETLSTSLGRALTQGSDALWFVPYGAVQTDFAAGLLRRLPSTAAGTEEPVGLLLANDAAPAGPLLQLIGSLRDEARARRDAAATLSDGRRPSRPGRPRAARASEPTRP